MKIPVVGEMFCADDVEPHLDLTLAVLGSFIKVDGALQFKVRDGYEIRANGCMVNKEFENAA